jgi:hypothetical protein
LPDMDSHLVSVDLLPHVRYWPLADILLRRANARFGGKRNLLRPMLEVYLTPMCRG